MLLVRRTGEQQRCVKTFLCHHWKVRWSLSGPRGEQRPYAWVGLRATQGTALATERKATEGLGTPAESNLAVHLGPQAHGD